MATTKELQQPLISNSRKRGRKHKTRLNLTYKNTTMILAIICSLLITWVLLDIGWILWDTVLQEALLILGYMFYITISINWICNKLVAENKKQKSLPQTSNHTAETK